MQVFVIHGGTAFAHYDEFLSYLKSKPIDLEFHSDWKFTLQKELGEKFQVIQPQMPNKQNVQYAEWKLWFERHIPLLEDELILVGHSLGAIFLAKYLSENSIPKKVKAAFLIAAPYEVDLARSIPGFELHTLSKLEDQGGEIHLYHSRDDKIVPFTELAKFQAALPKAQAHVFEDRGHFNQEQFPELVEEIKKLA